GGHRQPPDLLGQAPQTPQTREPAATHAASGDARGRAETRAAAHGEPAEPGKTAPADRRRLAETRRALADALAEPGDGLAGDRRERAAALGRRGPPTPGERAQALAVAQPPGQPAQGPAE